MCYKKFMYFKFFIKNKDDIINLEKKQMDD